MGIRLQPQFYLLNLANPGQSNTCSQSRWRVVEAKTLSGPESPISQKLIVLLLLALALAPPARAGVTIHYEGTAASPDSVTKILAAVTTFAEKNKWRTEDASTAKGRLQRVIDEMDKDYEGRITGVVVRTTANCEPLYFQFGDDLFMQDFVKTQFAGADLHIQIVQLLESLRPYFKQIDVYDEGDYWETHNKAVLQKHIATVNSMIADIKKKNPLAKGPLRMKSGRIADVVE